MQTIPERLETVHRRIRTAELEYDRIPGSVQLLAVSKTQSPDTIRRVYELGQTDFGENYLQEALPKIRALESCAIQWHFIGRIQSNKTREVTTHFDWVHALDRFKIAKRLNDQRPENFKPLNVCLQVKLDDEPGKGGVEPGAVADLAQAIAGLPALRMRGLMAIPTPEDSDAGQRRTFARMRELLETLNAAGATLDTLSMGMSADMEAAIAEGATIVRIGTAVFGPRPGPGAADPL